jgi:hypothetical protein
MDTKGGYVNAEYEVFMYDAVKQRPVLTPGRRMSA